MPAQVIAIPGIGPVEFPDSMTADEVNAAAKKLYEQHGSTTSGTPIGMGLSVTPQIAEIAQKAQAIDAANAQRDQNWPADVASKLPAALQRPAAMGLSLIQPAAEIASVAGAAPALLRGAAAARAALSEPADALLTALMKRIGADPDALELAATRMRLQAARSQTRQAKMAGAMAPTEAPAPTMAGASPETAPVPPAPQSPPATPVVAPSTPPPSTSPVPTAPVTGAAKVKLPADVAREVDRMVQRGMSDAQIQRVVLNTLKLRQSLQTPTDVDVAAAIRARNETGRWPD